MEGAPKLIGMRLQINFLSLIIDTLFPQTNKLMRNSHFVLKNSPVFILLDTLRDVL